MKKEKEKEKGEKKETEKPYAEACTIKTSLHAWLLRMTFAYELRV